MKWVKGAKLELKIDGSKMQLSQQQIWERDYGSFPREGHTVIITNVRDDGWLEIKCAYPNHIRQFWPPEYFKEAEQITDEYPAPDGWVSVKPVFDKECILLVARFYRDMWNYELYTVERIGGFDENGNSCSYLALVCSDGEEWGDIEDLKADMYKVMPLLPLPQPPKQ